MFNIAGFYELLWDGFVVFLTLLLFLNIFGLPANWIILGLIFLWQLAIPGSDFSIWFWILAISIAVAGEIAETGMQIAQGKKYGSSTAGNFAGLIGAIAGAIILAPLFWGFGAFIGAMCGAWLGCLVMELLRGADLNKATTAAYGAMMGRFLGSIIKIAIGAVIIALAVKAFHFDLPVHENKKNNPPAIEINYRPAKTLINENA